MASFWTSLKNFLGLAFFSSEIDQFLKKWDKDHPKLSSSQRAEINKYERIYRLRDNAANIPETKTFWDKF